MLKRMARFELLTDTIDAYACMRENNSREARGRHRALLLRVLGVLRVVCLSLRVHRLLLVRLLVLAVLHLGVRLLLHGVVQFWVRSVGLDRRREIFDPVRRQGLVGRVDDVLDRKETWRQGGAHTDTTPTWVSSLVRRRRAVRSTSASSGWSGLVGPSLLIRKLDMLALASALMHGRMDARLYDRTKDARCGRSILFSQKTPSC